MILKDSEVGVCEVWQDGKKTEVPFYTCGHCNVWIAMRSERTRPRVRCRHCSRLICEKTQLCSTECTPVADLVKDKLEGRVAAKWGTHLDEALGGTNGSLFQLD